MAVYTSSQRSILGVTQALFDAAPGASLFSLFSQVIDLGISLPLLVTVLARTPLFNSRYSYPDTLSTSAFATQFVNDLTGSRATQSDKNVLVATIIKQVNSGMSRSDAMSATFDMLLGISDDNPAWGAAAAYYKGEVVNQILDNLLGTSSGIIKAKTDLANLITAAIANDGKPLGDLVVLLVSVLDAIPEYDPLYGEAAHRFDNKLEVSGYYSLNLAQSGASMADLQSVITPVTADNTTVSLAKMKADYFMAHAPYSGDTMVITASTDISGIDASAYHKLIIDTGTQSLKATATMKASQVDTFTSITKGEADRLAVVDTIANINAYAGKLLVADSVTGLVSSSTDLTSINLANLTGLKIDDATSAGITVTVTATQAAAFFSNLTKGARDMLAVVDTIANINSVSSLSHADQVTGVISTAVDLANISLSRLTDLTIGKGAGATMTAAQAEKLAGHIIKESGSTLTLYVVPSEISSLPIITDAFICTVIISKDLRSLDLTKCISMNIDDGASTSIAATVLANQAQSLSERVTKGMSDTLVVDDTPAKVLATTDLSAADAVYGTDLSGNKVAITETELDRFTMLRTAGETTLNNATSSKLPQDVAKISLSTGGTLLVNAAAGNVTVALGTMSTITRLTAQPGASITLTDATNAGLPSAIQHLQVSGGGQIKVIGATGENLTISEAGLAWTGSVTAARDASITLTDATGAGLINDLSKLKVSGSGGISVTGALDESFTVTEDALISLKSLTAYGSGNIAINNVYNANLATVLGVTTIAGTGSVAITGAATENLTISSALLASEPVGSVTAANNQSITLADAAAASLATDTAKLHVSGTGKINILGATGQSLSFTEAALATFGTVAATGGGNVTITDVTAAKFATDLVAVSVMTGTINMLLASGQALTVAHAQLTGPVSITAASGDSIWLTAATGSTLASDLSKLHVSGGGAIDVTGASNENLALVAAGMTAISGIHAAGTGNIVITDAAAANVESLLNKLSISGTGTASVTFTDAQTAFVSASAANNRRIIASDTNGGISIDNAAGKQIFYAAAGANGYALLETRIGDSTGATSTCDVLNVISSGTTMVGLSAISNNDSLWNVTTTGKATALSGTGIVLDPAKYDVYIATVSGSDYIVYETSVNGSTYEALKIIGTVTPAALQMNTGMLYL